MCAASHCTASSVCVFCVDSTLIGCYYFSRCIVKFDMLFYDNCCSRAFFFCPESLCRISSEVRGGILS